MLKNNPVRQKQAFRLIGKALKCSKNVRRRKEKGQGKECIDLGSKRAKKQALDAKNGYMALNTCI